MNERDELHNRPGDVASDEPLPLGAREPVDVVQVRADEALIAALASASDVHVDDPIDERLAGLLQAWRDDVQAEPEPELIDLDTAMAAVAAAGKAPVPAPQPRRRTRPTNPLGPFATAAAVLVVAFIGLGLAARGAEPGDALWGVTKVLYTDRARSVEAAGEVRAKLDEADRLIKIGNNKAALALLQQAKQKLTVVAPEDGKDQLEDKTMALESIVTAESPTTTTPPSSTTPATDTGAATTSEPEQSQPPPAAPTTEPVQVTTTTPPSAPPSSSVSPPAPTEESPPAAPGGITDLPRSGSGVPGTDPPANSHATGARGRP